jgi:hypothetical protein
VEGGADDLDTSITGSPAHSYPSSFRVYRIWTICLDTPTRQWHLLARRCTNYRPNSWRTGPFEQLNSWIVSLNLWYVHYSRV